LFPRGEAQARIEGIATNGWSAYLRLAFSRTDR
jgi:hypothetical protein